MNYRGYTITERDGKFFITSPGGYDYYSGWDSQQKSEEAINYFIEGETRHMLLNKTLDKFTSM
jgi:hypothetical protein